MTGVASAAAAAVFSGTFAPFFIHQHIIEMIKFTLGNVFCVEREKEEIMMQSCRCFENEEDARDTNQPANHATKHGRGSSLKSKNRPGRQAVAVKC